MNQPLSELERLPSWKVRLLEGIQNLSATHARVLLQGHPEYQPHYGEGTIAIQTWRAHLRALEADRGELEIHATAVGVPATAIAEARAAGQRGLQWEEVSRAAPTLRHGEDPVRAQLVDAVASDVWQLEHMAVIAVEHRLRGFDGRVARDGGADAQFDANMVALWARANTTAHVIGLTTGEAAELWERDPAGWQQLAVAVRGYDDAELHERWRTYAWPGIEHQARRGSDHLVFAHQTQAELDLAPPTPHVLIHHATQAIVTIDPALSGTTRGIGAAVEAALPDDTGRDWVSETSTETEHRATDSGPARGYEL
ncbi:hypothetical protein [Nocardia lijiangensis]|uniref:hypothetical protein n=1 Tax=Nocardia lijiangensis TaxID=299618 RepID=UPI0008302E13|nr:hypothetical protein [Nocardia lijiangensis]